VGSFIIGVERTPPEEYIEFVLCKFFGWTPSQVDAMDKYKIEVFLRFIEMEDKRRIFANKQI